jgi:hypothetical protein
MALFWFASLLEFDAATREHENNRATLKKLARTRGGRVCTRFSLQCQDTQYVRRAISVPLPRDRTGCL